MVSKLELKDQEPIRKNRRELREQGYWSVIGNQGTRVLELGWVLEKVAGATGAHQAL